MTLKYHLKYRWIILSLCWALAFISYSLVFSSSPLLGEISKDLMMSGVEKGLILGTPSLMFVCFSIIGGILADTIGLRGTVLGFAFLMVFSSVLRAISFNFASFFLFSALMSVGIAVVTTNLPKIATAWFGTKEMGLATSIYLSGAGIGNIVILATEVPIIFAATGTWQAVFVTYGSIGIIVVLLWIFLSRNPETYEHSTKTTKVRLSQIIQALYNKDLLLLSIYMICNNIIVYGVSAFLPLILEYEGFSPSYASLLTSTVFMGTFMMSLLVPMISAKIGLRRPFLLIAGVLLGTVVLAIGVTPKTPAFLPVFIGGCTGTQFSLSFVLPTELVDRRYIGTAMGASLSIAYIGGAIGPVVTGYFRDLTGGFMVPLVLASVTMMVGSLLILFMKETGRKR